MNTLMTIFLDFTDDSLLVVFHLNLYNILEVNLNIYKSDFVIRGIVSLMA